MGNTLAYKKIGAKIKLLLDIHNLSYRNAAKEIGGWSGASIGNWIRTERTPPNEALQKIADYFNLPRSFFFKEFQMADIEAATHYEGEEMDINEVLYIEAMADYVRERKNSKQ